MRKAVLGFMLGALVLAGCSSSGADDSQKKIDDLQAEVDALKSENSATTTAPNAVTTTQTPVTSAAPTTAAPTTAPMTTAPAASPMPDVVCMNLQDAQDYIQEVTDVFYSRSEDATGQGRSQIIDSNWIVVGQRPDPGVPIGEGDAVLSVVKTDEANPC